MPAIDQGSAVASQRGSSLRGGSEPTALPHRWQKRAPGESADAHAPQIAPSTGAPQLAQKRPAVAEPQRGQAMVSDAVGGDDIDGNLAGRRPLSSMAEGR